MLSRVVLISLLMVLLNQQSSELGSSGQEQNLQNSGIGLGLTSTLIRTGRRLEQKIDVHEGDAQRKKEKKEKKKKKTKKKKGPKLYEINNKVELQEKYQKMVDEPIVYNSIERYELQQSLGEGVYGQVFMALDKETNQTVAVKALFNKVGGDKLEREIKILKVIKGVPGTLQLLDVCRDEDGTTYIITNFVNTYGTDLSDLLSRFSQYEIQHYLRQLLETIAEIHERGVMHRDIKNANMVIDPVAQEIHVLDYGLGHFYTKGEIYSMSVASRYHKAPEVLLPRLIDGQVSQYQAYDQRLDEWSIGCVMGAMIFKASRMFMGSNDESQLIKIAEHFGQDVLYEYMDKYNLTTQYKEQDEPIKLLDKESRIWSQYIGKRNEKYATDSAIDLISKLLQFDYHDRITAREALDHPFFKEEHEKIITVAPEQEEEDADESMEADQEGEAEAEYEADEPLDAAKDEL